MAKWAGKIGFTVLTETSLGVWEDVIIERKYTGDLIKQRRMIQNTNDINDSINISNQISFIADPYALMNFNIIRYATYMGVKWKVLDVSIESPRLVLTLGDKYNEI